MRRPAQLCHDRKFDLSSTHSEGKVVSIVFAGIDFAKNVFALHGMNAAGAVQLRQPKVARARLNELVAALPACTIGIEACSGAPPRPSKLCCRPHRHPHRRRWLPTNCARRLPFM